MPRPLVFGNGSFLLQLDRRHRVRDLCFPFIGQFNHLAGHAIRMGVWRDGRFSWCDSDEWEISQLYEDGSLVGHSRLRSAAMEIELELVEAVDPNESVFQRNIRITNLGKEAEIRLFFSHDLRLEESDLGDTALYHPNGAIIHYKRHSAILFAGKWGEDGIYQFQCATRHGAWPESDAEDGALSMNPIEQGSVASVFSLRQRIGEGEFSEATYWILAARSLQESLKMREDMRDAISAARAFNPIPSLPAPLKESERGNLLGLYQRSLLTILTQINSSNGAILAANDSDILETARATYSYLWMRDGALVCAALDRAGLGQTTRSFFDLCAKLWRDAPVGFQHKYCPDGALGASWHPYFKQGEAVVPFQEDSTALVVWALGVHMRSGGNRDQLQTWYDGMIKAICCFLAEYVDDVGLPKPSWDLWEERRGVHAYSAATVIAGLRAGAEIASFLGHEADGEPWRSVATRMAQAVRDHLWNTERGCFYRMQGDPTIDSATLAFGLFGIFPPDDPLVIQNANTIEATLAVRGGLARYEGDYYFRQLGDMPGNPWVITTMWLAQTRILQGDLEAAERALQWVRELQEPTGILAEQYHPETGEPLSVSPLTWSHAEVVRTIQMLCKT